MQAISAIVFLAAVSAASAGVLTSGLVAAPIAVHQPVVHAVPAVRTVAIAQPVVRTVVAQPVVHAVPAVRTVAVAQPVIRTVHAAPVVSVAHAPVVAHGAILG